MSLSLLAIFFKSNAIVFLLMNSFLIGSNIDESVLEEALRSGDEVEMNQEIDESFVVEPEAKRDEVAVEQVDPLLTQDEIKQILKKHIDDIDEVMRPIGEANVSADWLLERSMLGEDYKQVNAEVRNGLANNFTAKALDEYAHSYLFAYSCQCDSIEDVLFVENLESVFKTKNIKQDRFSFSFIQLSEGLTEGLSGTKEYDFILEDHKWKLNEGRFISTKERKFGFTEDDVRDMYEGAATILDVVEFDGEKHFIVKYEDHIFSISSDYGETSKINLENYQ